MKNTLQTEPKKLLDLYLAGKLKNEQLDDFIRFLQTREGRKLLEEHIRYTDFSADVSHILINKDQKEKIYQQINSHINKPSRKHFGAFLRIAASFLLVIALGSGIVYFLNTENTPVVAELINVSGDQQQMVNLPDGTQVRLNKGSHLSYYADMNKHNKRQVSLNGEAFFKVVKNPEKPFVVDAGKAEVKVLGTRFNVKSSVLKDAIIVAVQEGKVSFKSKRQQDDVILTADEVGILYGEGNTEKITQPAQNYFSWFEHFLEFDKMPLSQVITQIETIYDIHIEIADQEINNQYFTAYMQGTSVDKVMNQLARSFELKLEKKDGKFLLRK